MATFGEKITELRKSRTITQEDLAAKIGVTAQAVSKWENGANMPDVMLLPVIADVFDVAIDDLFSGRKISLIVDYNTAPVEAYRAALRVTSAAFEAIERSMGNSYDYDIEKMLKEDNGSQHGIRADDNTCVYFNREMAVAYLKPNDEALGLFEDEDVKNLLRNICDETFVKVLKYMYEKDGAFTAASLTAKLGISEEETIRIIEELSKTQLGFMTDVDNGEDEKLTIFNFTGRAEMRMKVLPLLSLAKWLCGHGYYWHGFRG